MRVWLVFPLLLISHWAFAQTPGDLDFQSRFDQFQLKKAGKNYQLAGRAVDLGPFEQLLPLFDSSIEGDCPPLAKPDLTVTARIAGQSVQRRFFISQNIVSDGKYCGSVSGEGLFFAPLHRSWFDDNVKMTIAINSPLKLTRGEETLVSMEKTGGGWKSRDQDFYPNWEFFDAFAESLRDFTITHRLHRQAGKDKPGFVMFNGKRKYEFFKINETMWAAAIPGQGWLISSRRWTGWNEMEKSQWMDRNSDQLAILADPTKPLEERKAALGTLSGQWSPSIRQVLAKILVDREDSAELKGNAVAIMRMKPTMENMGTFVQALSQTEDSDLQFALSQALKIRNPKGPGLNVDLDESSRLKAIREWQQWWKGQKNSGRN